MEKEMCQMSEQNTLKIKKGIFSCVCNLGHKYFSISRKCVWVTFLMACKYVNVRTTTTRKIQLSTIFVGGAWQSGTYSSLPYKDLIIFQG